jgi:hypothetical protein
VMITTTTLLNLLSATRGLGMPVEPDVHDAE